MRTHWTPQFALTAVLLVIGCKHQQDSTSDSSLKRQELETEFRNKLACKAFEKGLIEAAQEESAIGTTVIDSVFYSNKENSCLVAKRTMYLKANKDSLEIDDVLNNRELWYQPYDHMLDALSAEMNLHKQIDEMK